ncbi:MAG: agmatine deiminase family protein [Lentimicrobiaceae bacterium]|nr:agmatine deiminase family protein [Lentimicrobiaceae bacterium]
MKKNLLLVIVFFSGIFAVLAQPIYNEDGIRLYHVPSQEEMAWAKSKGIVPPTVAPAPPPTGQLRPIAEYEPAEAVLVRYPFGIPVTLIQKMAEDTKVITIVTAENKPTVVSQYNQYGVKMANCDFLIAPSNSYWTRDYGPWFMAIDNGEVAIYDFTYNRTYSGGRYQDNQINTQLAAHLSGDGVQIDRYTSTLLLAGGNYMNDGTSQAASSIEQFYEDNPGWTVPQIKAHFLEYLGVEQYHLLNDALGDYINHIDCWGKYLAPDKVMIGQVPANHPRYNAYETVANYFASLTSPYGTPMRVYRVYTPGTTNNPTPYTNSLILNKKVFIPLTGNANDAAAVQAYKDAMPGYQVFGINYNFWESTDALHCRTHEIADRCMLYIKHQPIFGNIAHTGEVTFSTELYSYCENNIYSDSVIAYVRVDGGEYVGYHMAHMGNNTWEVTVSDFPNKTINVEYYIFAADESGRRECHPYIGAPDPHKFNLVSTGTPLLSLDKTSSYVVLDGVTVMEDQITLSNHGDTELEFEITDIQFTAKLDAAPLSGKIQPNSSQVITLTYDCTGAKNIEYTGSMKLLSNDPITPEVNISLRATVVLGINDVKKPSILIYPNPANTVVNINYNDVNPTKACIYNFLGLPLKEITLTKGTNTINLKEMPAGIYFIKIKTGVYKVIKQ